MPGWGGVGRKPGVKCFLSYGSIFPRKKKIAPADKLINEKFCLIS